MRAPEYLGPLENLERFRVPQISYARLDGRDTAKPEILARIRNLCGSSSSMTRAGSAFSRESLARVVSYIRFRCFVIPGNPKSFMTQLRLAKNYINVLGFPASC